MFPFPVSHWGGLVPTFAGSADANGTANAVIAVTRPCKVGTPVVVFAESTSGDTWGGSSTTDSRGNVYTLIVSHNNNWNIAAWYSVLTTALQVGDAITTTAISAGGNFTNAAYNIPKVLAASPVDLASAAFFGTGSSLSATVAARSHAPEIIFAWATQHAGFPTGVVQGGGFKNLPASGFAILGFLVTNVTTSLPYTLSWTQGSAPYTGMFVSFKL